MSKKIYCGYKVVTANLKSAVVNDILATKYKINKWVSRDKKHGPLAVFNNIESAKRFKIENDFIDQLNKLIIYKCKYKRSKLNRLMYKINYEEYDIHFRPKRDNTINKKNNITIFELKNVPYGTDFASSVMLLSEQKCY